MWHDARNGTWDIYTQRVNAFGSMQWTPNGVPVCTARSNQSFPKYCKENIFNPLDMKSSSFYLSDFDLDKIAVPYFWFLRNYIKLPLYEINNHATGGLKSTICDLSKFLIIHLNDGVYNGTRIVNKSTIDMMQTIQYPNGSDGFAWKFREFSDGKTYKEDEVYALRFRYVAPDGIVREYGRRRKDNEIVMINVKEVSEKRKPLIQVI